MVASAETPHTLGALKKTAARFLGLLGSDNEPHLFEALLVISRQRVERANARRQVVEGGRAVLVRLLLVLERPGTFTHAGVDEYVALRRHIRFWCVMVA